MRHNQRGATLVEAAIVFSLLVLTLVALTEFALAFKDWLSVSHAAREGARQAASYGDDPRTDILALHAIEQALEPAGATDIEEVEIYDPDSGLSTTYRYTPGGNCGGGNCCDWTPCPDPDLPSPPYSVPDWDPLTRDVSAPTTDRVGVRITYLHTWITGLIISNVSRFEATVEYQIEPQIFEAA